VIIADLEPHEEHGYEEVEGLPAPLPPGETMLWQGRSNAKTLAIHAYHVRSVGFYFAVLAIIRGVMAAQAGAGLPAALGAMTVTIGMALVCLAILWVMASATAKKSLFTITSKRVVLRHGVGIRKYVNVPYQDIVSVGLKTHPSGTGDIALTVQSEKRIPFLHLWPFARPMRFGKPVPLLRGIPQAKEAATILADAMNAWAPNRVEVHTEDPQSRPETDAEPLGDIALEASAT